MAARQAVLSPQHLGIDQVMALQRTAGNAAVSVAVQRGIFDRLKSKPKPEPKTWEKKSAKKMTSDEGVAEMGRVKEKVQGFLDLRDKLVSKGMSPEAAARTAFSQAPPDVKRYLPLHSEFDVVKRQIDQGRTEEGGTKQGQISGRMGERAQKLGYRQGVGDPMELSPKEIAEELDKDVAFKRQMQRRAERLLSADIEGTTAEMKAAEEAGDKDGAARARRKLDSLKGEGAVDGKLLEIAQQAKQAIEETTAAMIEETKAKLGVDRVSDAEKWRLREEAKRKIRKQMESKFDSDLKTTGSVFGGIGSTVGALGSATKGIGSLADKKTLSKAQQGFFKGMVGSVGGGLKAVGSIFSKAVKLAATVNDRDNDKLDKDANVEIAQQAVSLVSTAGSTARTTLQAITNFNQALQKDPGFANAIPGLALFTAIAGYVGNCIAVNPPTERLAYTAGADKDAVDTGNRPLSTALRRTNVENKRQIATEVVGATANAVRIGASIAEIATAGGMGVPAAIRSSMSAMDAANKAGEWLYMESYRGETQEARKEGVLQVEGSGEKLISTDIAYAVDTVIMVAKKALQKKPEDRTEDEKGVILVLESYGVKAGEASRMSMAEIHERMLDKLDQDDEQATLKMKLNDGLEKAKEFLDSLGGDKEEEYQTLDEYARDQEAKAQEEAGKTTGDKVKEGFATFGKYVKKVVTAPAKITKLGEMASEKTEKVRRLQEIKNLVNYKDRKDRGRAWRVGQFSQDLEPSIKKLRAFIVATQPKDTASVYLKELNTLSEQQKITKKVGQRNAEQTRQTESVTDRVVTPALVARAQTMSFEEVREALANPNLSKADRQFLRYQLGEKAPIAS